MTERTERNTPENSPENGLDSFLSNLSQRLLPFDFAQGREGLGRVILLLVGIILVAIGIFTLWPRQNQEIKILSAETQSSQTQTNKIKIDVSGAVLNPGVYELSIEARVGEALQAAGGITEEANQEWVAKNLNLAQKLSDGAKIYVPQTGEPAFAKASASQEAVQGIVTGKININVASASELDTLAGIGPVTAKKIIDNRPYQNTEDLRTKKVLGEATFQKIKDQITAY